MKRQLMITMSLLAMTGILNLTMPKNLEFSQKQPNMRAEIKGEVKKPGVYEIEAEETLEELIQKAGGFSDHADCSALSLMQRVEAGELIVIPIKKNIEKISINSATKEQLMTLPGIGETKAEAILQYRQSHQFKRLEDLMKIKGIGEKIFAKLKEMIQL